MKIQLYGNTVNLHALQLLS